MIENCKLFRNIESCILILRQLGILLHSHEEIDTISLSDHESLLLGFLLHFLSLLLNHLLSHYECSVCEKLLSMSVLSRTKAQFDGLGLMNSVNGGSSRQRNPESAI